MEGGPMRFIDYQVQQERYERLLQEAETERLYRQLQGPRRTGDHLSSRALSWLGRRLITWGESLQGRYGSSHEGFLLPGLDQECNG